jgi:hypothetical protein
MSLQSLKELQTSIAISVPPGKISTFLITI